MNSYEHRNHKDSKESQSPKRQTKLFSGRYYEYYGQNQPLRVLSELSRHVYTGGLRDALTEPELQHIILRSRLQDSGQKRHEQCMEIEQQGVKFAKSGQELERYGWRVRKLLDGYFPSMADTLGLTESQFIEYDKKTKVGVENLQLELEIYSGKLAKYVDVDMHHIDHVNQLLESVNLQDSDKYKASFKQYKDSFTSLQTALKEFSEQFANEKSQVQNILKAAQEIADRHKKTRDRVDDPERVQDIVDNPELARDLAANPKLLGNILVNLPLAKAVTNNFLLSEGIVNNQKLAKDIQANSSFAQNIVDSPLVGSLQDTSKLTRELVQAKLRKCLKDNFALALDIAKNRKLVQNMLRYPHEARIILDNFEIAKEIADNCELAEKILHNRVIAQYIVDHLNNFQGINYVVTIKENATALFSKMLETEKKLSQFHKTVLLADLKRSFEEN